MAVVGYLFLLAVCLFSLVESVSLNCAECYGVLDPTTCHTVKRCQAEIHRCVTEAYYWNGQIQYDLSCQPAIGICHSHVIFGNGSIVSRCKQCCRHDKCNKHLCVAANIVPVNTTKATTAAPTTTAPVPSTTILNAAPIREPGCHDHEEDGLLCAYLDLFDACKQTSALAGVIAKRKCRKHCGICVPTAPQPTYAVGQIPQKGVCANYEQDGILCSQYDQYSLCNSTVPLGHVLATLKCSQHCGFCTPTTDQKSTLPPTTHKPGIRCLHCSHVDDVRHCNRYQTCSYDHVCATQALTQAGKTTYSFGCMSPSSCRYSTKRFLFNQYSGRCLKCCDGSSTCGRNLCQPKTTTHQPTTTTTTRLTTTRPVASSHGMKCLSCQLIDDIRKCTRYQYCQSGEECSTMVTSVDGHLKYSFSCLKPETCQDLSYFVNKRGISRATNTLKCVECCSSHQACNSRLCSQYTKLTTTPPTTTTKPTTTTMMSATATTGHTLLALMVPTHPPSL